MHRGGSVASVCIFYLYVSIEDNIISPSEKLSLRRGTAPLRACTRSICLYDIFDFPCGGILHKSRVFIRKYGIYRLAS